MKHHIVSCDDLVALQLHSVCCTSCHEDVDYGYELLEVYPKFKQSPEGYRFGYEYRIWAEVCCFVKVEWTRDLWAKLLRRKRHESLCV